MSIQVNWVLPSDPSKKHGAHLHAVSGSKALCDVKADFAADSQGAVVKRPFGSGTCPKCLRGVQALFSPGGTLDSARAAATGTAAAPVAAPAPAKKSRK